MSLDDREMIIKIEYMSRNMRRGGNMLQKTKRIHEFHELSGISITGIIKMKIKKVDIKKWFTKKQTTLGKKH